MRPAQAIAAVSPEKPQSAALGESNEDSAAEVTDRVNALEEALRTQSTKLEAMEKIIAQQQRMIEELSAKSTNTAAGVATLTTPSAAATTGL